MEDGRANPVDSYAYALKSKREASKAANADSVNLPTSVQPSDLPRDSRVPPFLSKKEVCQAAHGRSPQAPWQHGLLSCLQRPSLCCLTCCCPCVTAGRLEEATWQSEGTCGRAGALYAALLLTLCGGCLHMACNRTEMRRRFNIGGDEVGDLCVHCWCHCCALCQEYRELEARRFDLKAGHRVSRSQVVPQQGQVAPQQQAMAK